MKRLLQSFLALSWNTQGGVATYMALMLPIFVGSMGLVVDLAVWTVTKRVVQTTADVAAIAGALEIKRSGIENVPAAANEIAEANGYGMEGDTLTVNNPPATGPFSHVDYAVEVIVTREVPAFLSSIFIKGPITVSGRAVAVVKPNAVRRRVHNRYGLGDGRR